MEPVHLVAIIVVDLLHLIQNCREYQLENQKITVESQCVLYKIIPCTLSDKCSCMKLSFRSLAPVIIRCTSANDHQSFIQAI